MRRGREAMVGSSSLCRQRRLRTSSANPRKIMQQMERSAVMNCANCEGVRERRCEGVEV